jgi:histidyl-tRNA synthetase
MRNEPKPFRLFCMGTVYRYDEPQRGRYREIWQSNYELIGSSRLEADAEIIMLTDGLMRQAGLKGFDVKVGHVGILRGILGQERVGEREQSAIMQLMDKKEYDNALKMVESAGASPKCLEVLRQLVECRGTDVTEVVNKTEELVKNYEKSVIAAENLRETLKLVSESGCKINVTVDAGFARGLEYYTGMIFEVYVPSIDVALGGGGRYDKLVELFGGEPTPAVGIAHGIDRIVLAMKMQKTVLRTGNEKTVVVVPIKEELSAEALKISRMLRDAGVLVEVEVMGRRMAKALEDADRRRINYAIIVGERELSEGAVVVRDLAKRQQSTVKVERIIDLVKG